MPTGNILQVGITGLRSFQRTLNTIGHNVSNVNTEGYSRQRTELNANDPSPDGGGFVGNGVRSVTTRRMFDDYAMTQVRTREASTEFYTTYHDFATQVDNLLADKDASLSPALESFFDSVQGVTDDPVSIPAREVMLTQAKSMVDRFHTMEQWLADLRKATNSRIAAQVSAINALASSIAESNHDIVVAYGMGQGQPPNDLLDKRDQLITELSKHIAVNTVPQDDGSVNVFIGKGQHLVLSNTASELSAQPNPDDPMYYEVTYVDQFSTNFVSISEALSGGDLGGVLEFRDNVLDPAFNHMGRLAVGMTLTFNDLHHDGMDLRNLLGQDFFTNLVPKWNNGYTNTGVGSVNVTFLEPTTVPPSVYDAATNAYNVNVPNTYDAGALTTSDYEIRYLGAAGTVWSLAVIDKTNKTSSTVTLDTALSTVMKKDGLYIDVSTWTPNVGDYVELHPTRAASRNFDLSITDPNSIAAASPLRTNAANTNRGEAEISEATLTDITNAAFTTASGAITTVPAAGSFSEFRVQFDLNAGVVEYTLFDPTNAVIAGPVAYTDGMNILAGAGLNWGYDFTIEGTPYTDPNVFGGDSFTVSYNTNGVSDNRNMRALANLQVAGTLIGGNASYHEAYSQIVTVVGNHTHQAEINMKAQEALRDQAKARYESISGVNLDEEAANMLRFQQAYQAAAQVISTADSLFQTLLSAVRR